MTIYPGGKVGLEVLVQSAQRIFANWFASLMLIAKAILRVKMKDITEFKICTSKRLTGARVMNKAEICVRVEFAEFEQNERDMFYTFGAT